MIIEKISIGHFGNLSDVTYELGPGLNVIYGENESGKSTVAAFVRYMLYGFGTHSAAGDLPEREKRISWETFRAEGTMDISLSDGRRLQIERHTEASKQGGRIVYREESTVRNLEDGSIVPFHARPGEAFFAVPEQVYMNTAQFGQLSHSHFNEGEMSQAMENLLFSGDESVSALRAHKTLEQARNSLSHHSGMGGAIYELIAKSDAIRNRLSKAARCAAQIQKTETELHSLKLKIAHAEEKRDELATIDEQYRAYLTIRDFDKMHEVENSYIALLEAQKAHRAAHSHEGFLPDEEYLVALKTTERVAEVARQNYLRTEERAAALRDAPAMTPESEELLASTEAAGGARAVEDEYIRLHNREKRAGILSWLFVALAALGLGAILFFLRPLTLDPVTAMSTICVLALLGLSGFFFSNRRHARRATAALCLKMGAISGGDLLCRLHSVADIRRAVIERTESIRLAEENAEITRGNYERFRTELAALAAKWGKTLTDASPAESVESIAALAGDFLAEDRRLAEEIAEVRGRLESLRSRLEGVSEIAIRAQLTPAQRVAMQDTNHRTIQEGLIYYRGTCEDLYEQQREQLEQLEEYRATAENPALLRSERAALEDRIAELQRRHRAYDYAADAVWNASDRLRAEISPRLTAYAGKLLEAGTEGRYPALAVSPRLSMTYLDGEARRPLPHMSGATREIAYIALRLALIDMLYREQPTLCFDESMAHQDDGRTTAILRFLTGDSLGLQSILFTCHRREADLAAAVSADTRCFTIKGEQE